MERSISLWFIWDLEPSHSSNLYEKSSLLIYDSNLVNYDEILHSLH